LCSNNSNDDDDDDDDDMSRNAENNNNSSNQNLQQQKRRRSSLLLVLSLIAFIELISGGTSVRRVSRVYELATDGSKRRQPLPLHNDHQENVDELALMMSRAMEKVLGDDFPGMIDGSSSKTNSLSFSCPMEPCGLSMLFMGDSLTRFQYISLVYFLRHGRWIDAPATIPHLVRPSDYLVAGEHRSQWSPWYQATMDLLAPYENCDCYREPSNIDTRSQYTCENRYYHDPVRNNTVTYVQAFGKAYPIRGHWRAEQAIPQLVEYHQTKNQSALGDTVGPMLSRVPYRWEGTWIDVIRGHVADLAPAVLIMNAGKWRHSFLDAPFRDGIVAALQNVSSVIPRVIWKTTTADQGGIYTSSFNETDAAMCNLLECLNTTWTMDVPPTLYVDKSHFLEPVYRLLNEQLLQQLGFAIPTGVSSVANVSSVSWYPERWTIPGLVRPTDVI
jgi:hypothetical protein